MEVLTALSTIGVQETTDLARLTVDDLVEAGCAIVQVYTDTNITNIDTNIPTSKHTRTPLPFYLDVIDRNPPVPPLTPNST